MCFHVCEVPRVDRSIQTESRMVVAKDWYRKNGELESTGYRVSIWEDEKVLEMDRGNGCIICDYA